MKVTLPEKVTGVRDALFVLEVEFPVASAERAVDVEVSGPIEPLDLSGSSRGGTYRIPVGLERLHVPMRVLADGEGEATVRVLCTEGPEAKTSEERQVVLEAGTAKGGVRWGRWAAVAAAILVAAGGAWGVTKFLGKGSDADAIPDLREMTQEQAAGKLEELGLSTRTRYESAADPQFVDRVIRTVPAAGETHPDDGMIELIVGRSEDDLAAVPAVVGEEEVHAVAALKAAGYRAPISYVDAATPDDVGRVLQQSPEAGTPLAARSKVELFVGREASSTTVAQLPDPGPGEQPGLPEPPPIEPPPMDPGPGQPGPGEPGFPDLPAVEPGPTEVPQPPIDPGPGAVPQPPVDPGPVEVPVDPVAPIDPGPGEVPEPPVTEPGQPAPGQPAPGQPAAGPAPTASDVVVGADGRRVIPDMKGWPGADAEAKLRTAGLLPVVMHELPPTAAEAGRVIRQRPSAGERRDQGQMVFLTVGEGEPLDTPATEPGPGEPGVTEPGPGVEPVPPTIPDPVPGPTEVPDPPVDPGPTEVPETPVDPAPVDPAAVDPGPVDPGPVDPGPVVPPYVEPVAPVEPGRVPDVVGAIREKAEGMIREAGFRYRIVLKATDYPPDGTVLGQDPAPGASLDPGREVVLEVAQAPPDAKLTVPRVMGLEREVAERMLRDAGFLVNVTFGGSGPEALGRVVDQAPVADALAPRRTWVEIVVGNGTGPRRTARGGPPDSGMRTPPVSAPPGTSSGLSGPPAVPPGPSRMPPPTPRGPRPLPPVQLPPRSAPKSASVPVTTGMGAREAVASVLSAGLIPIIEVDRQSSLSAGQVLRQSPAGSVGALPGDLVRLTVATGGGSGRFVNLPTAIGAEAQRARSMFARVGVNVEIVEMKVAGHPYAGTGRVAAQYPVSSMQSSQAARVTLWVVLP